MSRYELIKEYPGSPCLGTIVEKDPLSKSYYHRDEDKKWCILNNHVENNPEYWEKLNENIYWAVSTEIYKQFGQVLFFAWTIYKVEAFEPKDSVIKYFKTREEAEGFILYNKPCLSYDDVCKMFNSSRDFKGDVMTFRISEKSLKEFVKSKI